MSSVLERFRKLFSRQSPTETVSRNDDPFALLKWVEADQNTFGVRLLDCRSVSLGMIAFTADPEVAKRLGEQPSTGAELRGKSPSNANRLSCDLRYTFPSVPGDGPLFVAQEMEDKWNIYLYEGILYFTRSWTRKLSFRAAIQFHGKEAHIPWIEADADESLPEGGLALRQVDFLVKSHLLRREVPHPLPPEFPNDPSKIAAYSFSQYGRWASFATYADTTKVGV